MVQTLNIARSSAQAATDKSILAFIMKILFTLVNQTFLNKYEKNHCVQTNKTLHIF